MAAGSVTVAALRHRPRQALLVVVLAAVVTAAAALGPLYARAVEQSVLRTVVAHAPSSSATLVVNDASDHPASPDELRRAVRAELPPQLAAPVGGADVPVVLRVGGAGVRSRLTYRDGLCGHLTIVAGRCAAAAGEVLVSTRGAQVAHVSPGDLVTVVGGDPADGGVRIRATVVGLYGIIDPSAAYWAGRGSAPTSALPTADARAVASIDDVFTPWATLAAGRWPDLQTHLDSRLLAARTSLDDVPTLRVVTQDADAQVRTFGGASAHSGIGALLRSTESQRRQARTVIPLLAVQLAVLGIVVLAFVCAAATEQRRPEIALARLRGHGTRGAAAMLLRELGTLVIAGAVLGAALGWLTAEAVCRLWLEAGVRPEWRPPVLLAVAASVAAGLLAILAAATPTLRQPLTSLLRRVPPRATTVQVGLVEGAVVAAAVAGVVTLLSGTSGGVALLAPGLLAIAGGLLLAQATIPTAGPLARIAMRVGRVPWALAGLQIARRPALRRLIAIITVACALLVFAVDAWTVAGRNRTSRAEVETGAPVVLSVDAGSSLALRRALLDIDPRGSFATPVVTVASATETGPKTTAVEPAAFARIARWGGDDRRPTRAEIAHLTSRRPGPVRVTGDRVEVRATFRATGVSPVLGGPEPPLGGPVSLALGLADADGVAHQVDLGPLHEGTGIYRGTVGCLRGCELEQVVVNRTFGDFVDAEVDLSVTALLAGRSGSLAPVDLDTEGADAWQAVPTRLDMPNVSAVFEGQTLHLGGTSFGTPMVAQRGDHPVHPVALLAGDVPRLPPVPGRAGLFVTGKDLGIGETAYAVAGRLPRVPRSGGRGVLVDLAALVAGQSAAPAQTSYEVWLASGDPVRERYLTARLADHGISVLGRDTVGDHVAALASEGPSLALRLALLAGLVAVVLSAAVLVVGVATSGASRARDLAGLRVVGVPAATVRRASVREHLVVAVLGVLAGLTLGLLAAQAALPEIPLFATQARVLPLVLRPAWGAVLVTAVGCLLLLGAVSVVVGRALAASAVPARLREGR